MSDGGSLSRGLSPVLPCQQRPTQYYIRSAEHRVVPAIDLQSVTKHFGTVTALQNLSLTVREGEVFGFLGPNGAGKSTAIQIILGYYTATSGSGQALGHDIVRDSVRIREQTGVLPDGFGPLGSMTGRRHIEFAIESKDAHDDPDKILQRVGISDAAGRPVTEYSKGMAQRLMLGMALVDEPDLLILDEPTTGLDPNGARQLRQIVEAEQERGATVFFSSHILEQVEAVADRVGILSDGQLVAVDSIDGLRDSAGVTSGLELILNSAADGLADELRRIDGVTGVVVSNGRVQINCADTAKSTVVHRAHELADVTDITTVDASLEELFVSYTGGDE